MVALQLEAATILLVHDCLVFIGQLLGKIGIFHESLLDIFFETKIVHDIERTVPS